MDSGMWGNILVGVGIFIITAGIAAGFDAWRSVGNIDVKLTGHIESCRAQHQEVLSSFQEVNAHLKSINGTIGEHTTSIAVQKGGMQTMKEEQDRTRKRQA